MPHRLASHDAASASWGRRLRLLAIAALIASLILWLLLPRGAAQTPAPPSNVVRGAFHIHTTRSDGSGTPDDVAAAAARAGLQFIILTDHGDGTRPPDPPAYRSGVLTIDGIELNTTGGHYAVVGLPEAPYPLAGTAEAVIEDVSRLGGLGFASHPGSPRPSLRWTAWDAPFDGLEWINGDSEWRDEPRLPIARALVGYLFRAPESMARLLDRPSEILEQWDYVSRTRRVVALAGIDAHARLGYGQRTDPDSGGMHLKMPGYEPTFRTLSNHVVVDAPLSGNAVADARQLLESLRRGRVYSVIDGLATPGGLSFSASSGTGQAGIGDAIAIDGDVIVRASVVAPPGTAIVLFKNGERVHEVADAPLEMNGGTDPAVYRVEAYVSNSPGGPPVPWVVSNPIYAGMTHAGRAVKVEPAPAFRIPARVAEAAVESGRADTSRLGDPPSDPLARRVAGEPPLAWSYALSPGTPAGQFAAVRIPITGGLASFDRVRFTVTSPKPARAWVQLRAPVGNTERWGSTFYADQLERVIDLPLRAFAPIGATSSRQAPLDRVDSLLFVVDTLNFLPGASGSMVLSEIAFVR
jgi:hypothetical protein